MAYVDFANTDAGAAVTRSGGQETIGSPIGQTLVGMLDRREWDVVRLARGDGLGSLREPGWIARFSAWLLGREANRRLADPRLEALRRVAVLAWRYGYALPVSAIRDFKSAGFSMDQLETMLVKVTSLRAGTNARIVA